MSFHYGVMINLLYPSVKYLLAQSAAENVRGLLTRPEYCVSRLFIRDRREATLQYQAATFTKLCPTKGSRKKRYFFSGPATKRGGWGVRAWPLRKKTGFFCGGSLTKLCPTKDQVGKIGFFFLHIVMLWSLPIQINYNSFMHTDDIAKICFFKIFVSMRI